MSSSLLSLQTAYWQARDYLSPVLKESKFKEHGRITPEEFVAAGDFLTYKFPVWQWEKGDSSRARSFLPPDKQYLITRNVPCLRRATAVNYTDADEDAEKLLSFLDEAEEAPGPGEDEWVATHIGRDEPSRGPIAEIPDIDGPSEPPTMASLSLKDEPPKEDEIPDIDDIPDMEEAIGLEDDDNAAVEMVHPSESEVKSTLPQHLLAVRTYDIYISYDKHYQTPRFWLFGYDDNKKPLTPAETFQDVPSEVAFKTLTMEPFPHSGQQLASIHPCKHASVMKTFVARMDARNAGEDAPDSADKSKRKWGIGGMVRRVTGGVGAAPAKEEKKEDQEEQQERGIQVDFYLVIFLKFISSIVPTIEVDSTTSMSF